jgi:hypothetical protein
MFGPKGDGMTEVLIKLRDKELHNLHSSPNIIRNDQVKGHGIGRVCYSTENDLQAVLDVGQK